MNQWWAALSSICLWSEVTRLSTYAALFQGQSSARTSRIRDKLGLKASVWQKPCVQFTAKCLPEAANFLKGKLHPFHTTSLQMWKQWTLLEMKVCRQGRIFFLLIQCCVLSISPETLWNSVASCCRAACDYFLQFQAIWIITLEFCLKMVKFHLVLQQKQSESVKICPLLIQGNTCWLDHVSLKISPDWPVCELQWIFTKHDMNSKLVQNPQRWKKLFLFYHD